MCPMQAAKAEGECFAHNVASGPHSIITPQQCDSVRPCTLCRRSGARCEPRENTPAARQSTGRRQKQRVSPPSAAAIASPSRPRTRTYRRAELEPLSPVEVAAASGSPAISSKGSPAERQRFGANSSAVGFAARIFGDSAASHSSDIANIPGHGGGSERTAPGTGPRWTLMTMLRPPSEALEALIDVFFDRMHWFILIFHEPSFRRSAQQVCLSDTWDRSELGPVLAMLMVSAIGLQSVAHDASWHGHELLAESSLEAGSLRDALVREVRFHLLDLLEDCSIETMQVCSLLGTYCIFHASPTLAWHVLGLAVRTAYALALHCDDDEQQYDPVIAQVRRRNWNHITVADTFAAMIYGRPACLDAAFSHLQPLHDLDDSTLEPGLSANPLLSTTSDGRGAVTKLTFHVLKFRLYEITRLALNRFRVLRLQNPISAEDLASLVTAVQYFRSLLAAWKSDLPPAFNFEIGSREDPLDGLADDATLSPEEQRARQQLSLQILTLSGSYDSAVIFIHRPLLEYRVPAASQQQQQHHHQQAAPSQADVARESLELSVSAALRISRLPVARLETHFVISFILMNFFTAGVILCIPPTIWPFSALAHEAKAGTLRIIRASRGLRNVSHIARHTEQLLTGLLRLSLQQEVDNGLQQDDVDGAVSMYVPAGAADDARNKPGELGFVNGEDGQVAGDALMASDTQLRGHPPLLSPSSTEQRSGADRASFPLPQDAQVDDGMGMVSSQIDGLHGDGNMGPNVDFEWPMSYGRQRHQVDSQLDEVFGTFGQSRLSGLIVI